VIKFGLKIKTRGGMIVDSLLIAARDRADVERKVHQMYHQLRDPRMPRSPAGNQGREHQLRECDLFDQQGARLRPYAQKLVLKVTSSKNPLA